LQWFAVDESEPLFYFAGIWTEWIGVRKEAEGKQKHTYLHFSPVSRIQLSLPSIHPRAMSVILTEPEEFYMWVKAPWDIAKELQQPLSSTKLCILH